MTVRMVALKSANMAEGATHVRKGHEFEAKDDRRAKELEGRGLARRADVTPLNKAEEPLQNKAAEEGPLDSDGGEEAGEEDTAPSSRQVRRPQRPSRSSRGGSGSRR